MRNCATYALLLGAGDENFETGPQKSTKSAKEFITMTALILSELL